MAASQNRLILSKSRFHYAIRSAPGLDLSQSLSQPKQEEALFPPDAIPR